MPAFVPYGTSSGEHRDYLARQAGAAAWRVYQQAEQQVTGILARLAARVLNGGLQLRRAQRKLLILGTAVLARAAQQLDRELATARRHLQASASAAAGGAARGAQPAAAWAPLQARIRAAGAAALRSGAQALAAASAAAVPQDGRYGEQAAAVSLALAALPVTLAAYTDTAGRTWHLSTYIRAAVTAAAAAFHISAQMSACRAAGASFVTAQPPGGCARCGPWAGRVLSLDSQYPAGTLTPAGVVAGTVAEALAAGLGHPHCRHDLTPVAA